ncbi:hypothetical protein SNE35_09770 [Paucibacter sp. R3-3]|uniref:TRAM domain-containing protein n=1 Tax=Roseateles agri TaxID=3098619 RepID=A0ABU5DG53_9BURK|nr:hypothetical protein [Paucibacter sp. R3-3]MDY0744796.1 hypothetical protein [Paucibacter sp. R3-3]
MSGMGNERVVEAVVTVIIEEFELVHLEAPGDLTLSIGELTPGVQWQDLRVGQRLRCRIEGVHATRVLHAEVIS